MTKFPDLFAGLAAPFDPREVRERSEQRGGRTLAMKYVQAGTVKNRLDAVVGREGWRARYRTLGIGESSVAVECRLAIRLPDGSRAVGVDAGQGKDFKAAYSDALKRAAEGLGVGRYLRPCGPPRAGTPPAPTSASSPARAPAEVEAGPPPVDTRRASLRFIDWARDEGAAARVDLVHHLNEWGRGRGYPGRLRDWSDDQVKAGVSEARRRLAAAVGAREPEPALSGGRP